MKYVLVTCKKNLPESPEIKVYEDDQYYKAKLEWKHYQAINVKADIWETDGISARKLNL